MLFFSVFKSDTLFRPYGDVDVIVGLSGINILKICILF
jgi:hypothetical protein